MDFFEKNKALAMTSKMHLAPFSLAKTFLHSYQGITAILEAWRTCYPNFFYKFIIHQSSYLGKQWVV